MKFNELKTSRQQLPRRSGRGISAGHGKTAGRGTKGQGARKSPVKLGFEGGQTPIHMRLPKLRGFKSHRPATETIYTGELEQLKTSTVDNAVLAQAGLVESAHSRVKLIVGGELKSKKAVKLQGASTSAIEAITKAGGDFEKVPQVARQSKKDQDKA